jgi:hypothetical protein
MGAVVVGRFSATRERESNITQQIQPSAKKGTKRAMGHMILQIVYFRN